MVRRRRRDDHLLGRVGLIGWVGPVGLIGLAGLAGCTHAPPPTAPQTTPPAELTAPAPPLEEAPTPPSAAEAPPASATPETDPAPGESPATEPDAGDAGDDRSSNVIVIDRGTGASKPSLWEAAVAERKRRATTKKSVASVTNENLHEYQDAELTFAQPKSGAAATTADTDTAATTGDGEEGSGAAADDPGAATEHHDEQYWRHRVLDIRTRLRDAVDTIDDLNDRVATLRRKFYSEDDPYVRDGQIKPAWDRALDRITRERSEVQQLRTELADALEEGHRDGAMPGWLREGIELEPRFDDAGQQDRRDGDLEIYEPTEPDTIDPDDTNPPDDPSANRPPPGRPLP